LEARSEPGQMCSEHVDSGTVGLEAPVFRVGDRVVDLWGNEHTITEIDPAAAGGTGVIRTLSENGKEMGHSMLGHGLRIIES